MSPPIDDLRSAKESQKEPEGFNLSLVFQTMDKAQIQSGRLWGPAWLRPGVGAPMNWGYWDGYAFHVFDVFDGRELYPTHWADHPEPLE
jgi:hypothetical protein